MGGVCRDALGGVHSDGIAVSDMVAQILPGKDHSGPVIEAVGRNAVALGVDGVDAPAVAIAYRVGCGAPPVETVTVGSLRRLMIRSPTVMRCPRSGGHSRRIAVGHLPVDALG